MSDIEHAATITDNDATIAAALQDAHIPSLMLALTHITGDMSPLRGDIRPQMAFLSSDDGLTDAQRAIMDTAMQKLALQTALTFEKANAEAAAALTEQGVTLHEFPPEELQKFRDAAQATWPEFATTPEAEALVASHMAYLRQLGLVSD